MFSIYDHDLLSDEARDISTLIEQTALAADLLGLAPYEDSITGSDYEDKALRALALQVNFQTVHDHDAEAHKQEILTGYHRTYAEKIISPKAKALADHVLNGIGKLGKGSPRFAVIRSRR